MEKEILYEINRFREILGLPLLKESIGGGIIDEFLTLFGKSTDEFEDLVKNGADDVAQSLRNSFDEIAQSGGKTFDDIITDIRAGRLSDDLATTIAETLVKSTNQKVSEKMAKAFINTNPTLKGLSDEIASPDKFASANDSDELQKLYNEYYDKIDELGESPEVRGELIDELMANFKSRRDIINSPGFVPNVVQNADQVVAKQLTGMLDETGELAQETTVVLDNLAKKIGVDSEVLKSEAKIMIAENSKLTLTQLKTKLAESQLKLKQVANGLKGEKRKLFVERWNTIKETLNLPKLSAPKKIIYSIVSIGALVGAYGVFEYFQTDKGEVQDILQRLSRECSKIDINKHVFISGSDENIDEFYAKVVYDGKLEQVVEKEGTFYFKDVKNNLGEMKQIECGDLKLADKTVEEIQGTIPSGEAKTEYNQTLDDFKKFLVDNSLGTDDATNDTGGASGFWKANGKDYSYDATTKTFKEE